MIMKLKAIYLPETTGILKSIGIYLGIITALFLLGNIVAAAAGGDITINSEVTVSSAIFLLVSGLVIYKEGLNLGLANGISRRTVFFGMLLVILTTAAIVTLGSWLITLVFPGGGKSNFLEYIAGGENPLIRLTGSFCINLAMYMVGFFGAACFYRLNKVGRTLFASGVPISLFVLLPIVFAVLPEAAQNAVISFFSQLFTFVGASMWNFNLVALIVAEIGRAHV